MQIGDSTVEQEETLRDGLDFVEVQDVAAGASVSKDNWAYKIKSPEGYVIFVQEGTQFAPEFRDSQGNKLDDSTRVIMQKCDRQGNPTAEMLINEQIGRWDYEKMRVDPDFQRYTNRDLMLDEREIAKVWVEIPSGANGFDAGESNLLVGDDTSAFGVPVEIIHHDDLSSNETQAVKAASQRGN